MKKKDIEIITERLILRVPTLEHAEEINVAMNEVWHELQLWMSWAYDDQKTLEATRTYITGAQDGENLPLVGFCRKSGRYAVSTGLFNKGDGVYETGYWVAKDFLGQGFATEATAATICHAFDKIGAEKIFINYYEGNEKSRRIIEKLGFSKTGVLEKAHARCLNGELLDEHQYGLTKEQWRQRCP